MSELAVRKKLEEDKAKLVPEDSKEVFDALLKIAVPPLEVPPDEETPDSV